MGCGSSKLKAALEKAGEEMAVAAVKAGSELAVDAIKAGTEIAKDVIEDAKEVAKDAAENVMAEAKDAVKDIVEDIKDKIEEVKPAEATKPAEFTFSEVLGTGIQVTAPIHRQLNVKSVEVAEAGEPPAPVAEKL